MENIGGIAIMVDKSTYIDAGLSSFTTRRSPLLSMKAALNFVEDKPVSSRCSPIYKDVELTTSFPTRGSPLLSMKSALNVGVDEPVSSRCSPTYRDVELSTLTPRRSPLLSTKSILNVPVGNTQPTKTPCSAMYGNHLKTPDTGTHDDDGIDIKSGSLFMIDFDQSGKEFRCKVHVEVFGNSYEQHAQIYTDTTFCVQLGYISLRNCSVALDLEDPKVINITSHDEHKEDVSDEMSPWSVTLIADSMKGALEWVKALKPRTNLPINSECSPLVGRRSSFWFMHKLSR